VTQDKQTKGDQEVQGRHERSRGESVSTLSVGRARYFKKANHMGAGS